jgi:hypothetical protein
VVGRSDGSSKGKCYIYKGTCSGVGNSSFDRYTAADTCLPRSGYNQYLTTCRSVMHRETCEGKDSWKTKVLNDSPTRKNTVIKLGDFSYTNKYCGFMRYVLEGTDASKLKITGWSTYNPYGAIFTYPTNIREPYTLRFNILVYAVGNRYGRFPSTIQIQGCDNEANTITNPKEYAWKTT